MVPISISLTFFRAFRDSFDSSAEKVLRRAHVWGKAQVYRISERLCLVSCTF